MDSSPAVAGSEWQTNTFFKKSLKFKFLRKFCVKFTQRIWICIKYVKLYEFLYKIHGKTFEIIAFSIELLPLSPLSPPYFALKNKFLLNLKRIYKTQIH